MEYTYPYSNSASSSYSYNSPLQYPPEEKSHRKPPPPSHHLSLHSVRKKNTIMKKPISPMPPTPPKVYKINPADFRDVVQRLTGASHGFIATRLREVAPPPLSISPAPVVHPTAVKMPLPEKEEKPFKLSESNIVNNGGISPLGFSLSPSSIAWCSSVLMSPGTLSSLEPSAVL